MTRHHTAVIDYRGVSLACEFDHIPGFKGDRIDPPYEEHVEFGPIKVGDIDICSLLTMDQWNELEGLCLVWVADDRAYQEGEHADMLRDERLTRDPIIDNYEEF